MPSESKVKGGLIMVIGFMLVAVLGAELLPTALDAWFNVSTSEWDPVTATLWDIAPFAMILGILFYFLGQAFDLF